MRSARVSTVRKKSPSFFLERIWEGGEGENIFEFLLDFCLFICVWFYFFFLVVLFEILKIIL